MSDTSSRRGSTLTDGCHQSRRPHSKWSMLRLCDIYGPGEGRVLSEPPEGAFRYISNDCWLQWDMKNFSAHHQQHCEENGFMREKAPSKWTVISAALFLCNLIFCHNDHVILGDEYGFNAFMCTFKSNYSVNGATLFSLQHNSFSKTSVHIKIHEDTRARLRRGFTCEC